MLMANNFKEQFFQPPKIGENSVLFYQFFVEKSGEKRHQKPCRIAVYY